MRGTCVFFLQVFSSDREKASVRIDLFSSIFVVLLKNVDSFDIVPHCGHASLLGFSTGLQKRTCCNVLFPRVL